MLIDHKLCARSHTVISGLLRNKQRLENELGIVKERELKVWAIVVVLWMYPNRFQEKFEDLSFVCADVKVRAALLKDEVVMGREERNKIMECLGLDMVVLVVFIVSYLGQRRRRGELGTEWVDGDDELAADRTRADEANRKHGDATESTTPAGNVCEGWKRCGAEDDGGYGERRWSGQCGIEETRRCLGNLAGHGQRSAMGKVSWAGERRGLAFDRRRRDGWPREKARGSCRLVSLDADGGGEMGLGRWW
ncbi:hypothetical protein M0R45_030934 [Rubus argutus]|uniref:Uncharacterized protein n=1 Tax=Rubus argutus TaxID=59490 RepID=A0AAW1WCT7_RUBAR